MTVQDNNSVSTKRNQVTSGTGFRIRNIKNEVQKNKTASDSNTQHGDVHTNYVSGAALVDKNEILSKGGTTNYDI